MKAINKKAQKVLETLIASMTDGYAKIDNTDGAFMPVIVEAIGDDCFSVAHYYEQDCDLVPDPEMVFLKGADGKFYPVSFQSDFGLQESVIFEDGKPSGIRQRMQNEQATFAGKWLANIKMQQGI